MERVSVLEGEKDTVRDVLYGIYSGGDKPGMRCVKKGDWKLIRYEPNTSGVNITQLFNLADNPEELLIEHHDPAVMALTSNKPNAKQVNLAKDPDHADKLKEMEQMLLEEMRSHNDPYRFSNQPDDGLPAIVEPKINRPWFQEASCSTIRTFRPMRDENFPTA